jgi:hypothetical protein
MLRFIYCYPINLYRYFRWGRHVADDFRYELGVIVCMFLCMGLLGYFCYQVSLWFS